MNENLFETSHFGKLTCILHGEVSLFVRGKLGKSAEKCTVVANFPPIFTGARGRAEKRLRVRVVDSFWRVFDKFILW